MFMQERKSQKKPNLMFDDVWNSLLSMWNTVTYCAKCSQVQQNQASKIGGSLHTSSSITRDEHAIRIVSTLNTNDFYSL